MVTAIIVSSCGSDNGEVQDGVVEIEYSNSGSEPIEFDIIRVDWTDDSILESASFLDGFDLGISGSSPAQGSIDTIIAGEGEDWLRLIFDTGEAPEGLKVTIVTSTGATLTHEYSSH
jgi:hypothetical protein